MSPLQWVLLGGIFTVYLIFGGCIYMVLEQRNELREHAELSILKKDIQEILLRLDRDFYHNGTPPEVLDAVQAAKEGVINRISEACGGNNLLDEHASKTLQWTFYNSLFFAFTAITTIGYGNLAPATRWSRIFTIFYTLIGIPINGILLTKLSDFFSSKLVKAHERSKEKESRISFAFNIIFYLIPGLLVFIIAPAGFFVMIENWSYLDAIYFCFVTLTTIGFGDYVAGMGDGHNIWLWVYKIVIIVWIVFGLGYLVMILGFITKGITSKKVRGAIGKRLNGIRTTKEKLTRDVEYMRRVVNELYLMKSTPGYEDAQSKVSSAEDERLLSARNGLGLRRTLSLHIPRESHSSTPRSARLVRSHSEGNLKESIVSSDNGASAAVDHQKLLTEIIVSLQGNISNVIEAVDELNAFENAEVDEAYGVDESEEDNEFLEENLNPDNLPQAWELGLLTESDEEILIDDDEEGNCLKQVVVHSNPSRCDDEAKSGSVHGILERVSEVLRKISSGTKPSNDGGASRKASRNDSERRNRNHFGSRQPSSKISRQQDFSNHTICSLPSGPAVYDTGQLHPAPAKLAHSPCHSKKQKASNSIQTLLYDEPRTFLQADESKISRDEAHDPSRNVSIESVALEDLLKALDSVHDKLSKHPVDSASYAMPGVDNLGFSLGPGPSPGSDTRHRVRRRKLGVFNPGFQYFKPDFAGNHMKQGKDSDNDMSFL